MGNSKQKKEHDCVLYNVINHIFTKHKKSNYCPVNKLFLVKKLLILNPSQMPPRLSPRGGGCYSYSHVVSIRFWFLPALEMCSKEIASSNNLTNLYRYIVDNKLCYIPTQNFVDNTHYNATKLSCNVSTPAYHNDNDLFNFVI